MKMDSRKPRVYRSACRWTNQPSKRIFCRPSVLRRQVPLASDADGKIAHSFHLNIDPAERGFKDTRGVQVGHGFAERTTFVVSSNSIIAATIGGLAPATNVDRALAAVQRLAGAGQTTEK